MANAMGVPTDSMRKKVASRLPRRAVGPPLTQTDPTRRHPCPDVPVVGQKEIEVWHTEGFSAF